MRDALAIPSAEPDSGPRYRARLVAGARATPAGLTVAGGASLSWGDVERAFAAEIGEPEGVRTTVFDLVVARDADVVAAWRIDAEPGEEATELARRITAALGPARASASIRCMAVDGVASRRHPDLASFEAEVLESLRAG